MTPKEIEAAAEGYWPLVFKHWEKGSSKAPIPEGLEIGGPADIYGVNPGDIIVSDHGVGAQVLFILSTYPGRVRCILLTADRYGWQSSVATYHGPNLGHYLYERSHWAEGVAFWWYAITTLLDGGKYIDEIGGQQLMKLPRLRAHIGLHLRRLREQDGKEESGWMPAQTGESEDIDAD